MGSPDQQQAEQQADATGFEQHGDQQGQQEPSSDDERHSAGPGERLTVDQTDKQDELDSDATPDSRDDHAEN
jgi:hypothetical protein